jgi:zinc transport system permease protein
MIHGFFIRAIIAGVVSGFLCAFIGIFVILRKMAFFSHAIAHVSLTGVAIGFLINVNPLASAIGFASVVSMLIPPLIEKSRLSVDTIIGILLPASMSLGVVLLGFAKGYKPDLLSYLFGDILAVSSKDLYIILGLAAFSILLMYFIFNQISIISFDEDWAKVSGIRVKYFNYLFVLLLSLIVVISIKIVGIILVSALVIIPGAAAINIAKNFRQTFIYAIIIGVGGGLGGIVASYFLNIPTGPSIVLAICIIFIFTLRRRK